MYKPTPIGALQLYYQPRRKRFAWRSLALTEEKRRHIRKKLKAKSEKVKERIETKPEICNQTDLKELFCFAKTVLKNRKTTKPRYFVP